MSEKGLVADAVLNNVRFAESRSLAALCAGEKKPRWFVVNTSRHFWRPCKLLLSKDFCSWLPESGSLRTKIVEILRPYTLAGARSTATALAAQG